MILIAISGPDGAGKSTLADAIRADLERDGGSPVVHLWLRWNPRRRSGTSTPTSTVSSSHRGHPVKRLLARLRLQRVWVRLAARSYRAQLETQLSAVGPNAVVLADRFTLDFLADQVGASLIDAHTAAGVYASLPKPTLAVVVMANDDVLRARLKPGDDAALVVERARVYRELAGAVGARIVDSTASGEVQELLGEIRKTMAGAK